jgi:MinD superfamily P-loop ATPase
MILCFALKGGSGTTVVACALALSLQPSLLIDLAGDVPATLGMAEPGGPGVAEWMRSVTSTADSLARLGVAAGAGVGVVPRGQGELPGAACSRLASALDSQRGTVVVDAGTGAPHPDLLAAASHSLLVTRPCYLSLRRASALRVAASGVVLIAEPGRALRARDVESATGAPVVAELLFDPSVGRAVDSGLLASRLPRTLTRLGNSLRLVAA